MTRNQVAFAIASAGIVLWAAMIAAGAATPSQIARQEIPGVRNMSQIEPTVACAGATDASAIPEIAKRGYKAIINLRLASETGADIDAARAAAAQAGIRFIHMPFDTSNPDEAVIDRFIAAVGDTANQPVFIHCASANRAAALWMIKRSVVDGWDTAKAEAEAREIGLSHPSLRDWAFRKIKDRRAKTEERRRP